MTVPSTHRADPAPTVPEPILTRDTPRSTAAGSPLGSLPTCSIVASVPMGEYLPLSRGTSSSRGRASDSWPGAEALRRAASMAALTSEPEVSTGTTMVGSTMVSSSGSTGSERVSGMARSLPVAALLNYSRYKRYGPNFVPQLVRSQRTDHNPSSKP